MNFARGVLTTGQSDQKVTLVAAVGCCQVKLRESILVNFEEDEKLVLGVSVKSIDGL
jgi:hypothetical protein